MTELATRLGFAGGGRVAIVHVDDLGMCHAANVGGFEALRGGPATCGSVMVPCPWFQEAADMAAAMPSVDLGVHLTLTAEWSHYRWGPVAGASAVPSLVDAQGMLPRTALEVAQRADPAEVEVELRAQIGRALAAGIDVTHLDSHMGVCFFPQFVEIYGRLGLEFGVPAFAPRADQEAMERAGLGGVADILRKAMADLEARGLPILDGFDPVSLEFAEGEGAAHNAKRLAGLPEGVHYLICHAAQDGEELRAVTPDSAHQRDFERRYYGGEEGRTALAEAGIQTLGMRPLRDLLRADLGS